MMRQYREAKRQHPEAILFFRMGDFYEMFDEDAVVAARLLGITLTSRDKKSGQPMAGVPWHAADGYIAKLVQLGHRVAICEQVEDPKQAKGLVDRQVTELITPGTATQPGVVVDGENTFLLSLEPGGRHWGVALGDASTGELWAAEFTEAELGEELGHLAVPEVLLPEGVDLPGRLCRVLESESGPPVSIARRSTARLGVRRAVDALCAHLGAQSLDAFDGQDLSEGAVAAWALIDYLSQLRGGAPRHMTVLKRLRQRAALILDAATLLHLDVLPERGGEPRGTVFGVLNQTQTPMGQRLLRQWLARPSRSPDVIEARLDAVEALATDDQARGALARELAALGDLERGAGRLDSPKCGPRELVAVAGALCCAPAIRTAVGAFDSQLFRSLAAALDPVPEATERIQAELVDAPPLQLAQGGVFRDGVNDALDALREAARSGKGWIAEFEARERQRTGIPKLKVGYNRVFGYYIEISKASQARAPADYQRKQTLVAAERFITPELKEVESKVLGAEERIVRLERQLFESLRSEVALHLSRMLKTARALGTLDVLVSLATVARERAYVRPQLAEGGTLAIDGGRHLVVEALLDEAGGSTQFVPNDTHLGGDEAAIAIVTGPNMAGKSTYLRQVGLITLLAHMGSFVPAARARVPLCDRIFTRVGAADRISRGQSTFLVEMNETAVILHHATDESLVLLDEVGRGTSTYDGVSIAWSVVEYLHDRRPRPPRTLFATHYHELTELAGRLSGVANYSVAVEESGGQITFLHHIVPGPANRSYGIHVAELAGLPEWVVRRATAILEELESGRGSPQARQLSLFDAAPPAVVGESPPPYVAAGEREAERVALAVARELADCDLNQMRPVEALVCVERWKRLLERVLKPDS